MRAKFIYEKFSQDSDPIQDLGIGMPYIWKNLKVGDIIQIKKYIRSGFPAKDDYILITFIDERYTQHSIKINYIHYIDYNNLMDGIKFPENRSHSGSWELSYPFFQEYFNYIGHKDELLKESVNEKFVEDSDPISDMGIGIKHFLKKKLEKINDYQTCYDLYNIYFMPICDKSYEEFSSQLVRIMYHTVRTIIEKDITHQDAFEQICKYEIHSQSAQKTILKIRKKVAEVLENEFHVNINPYIENPVNEKFIEDSDPVHDLGIGMIKQIEHYLNFESGYSYHHKQYGPIKSKDYLWMCTAMKKYQYVKYLLDNGWDIHFDEDRALKCAVAVNSPRLTEYLLKRGADVHAGDDWCFDKARENHYDKVFDILKKYR